MYTATLAGVLLGRFDTVLAVLARDMFPARLYPGRARLGRFSRADLHLPERVRVHDTLDWWPSPGTLAAWWSVFAARPHLLVLQWWTATMLHHYLLLAVLVRLRGGRVTIEFHETFDTAEARIPLLRGYVRAGMWLLARLATSGIVHSQADRERVPKELPVGKLPLTVVLHGPYHLASSAAHAPSEASRPVPGARAVGSTAVGSTAVGSAAEGSACEVPVKLLFFGVVRPYKGVDVLADALGRCRARFDVTVVGEPWGPEGRRSLAALSSLGADVVARYVSEEELAGFLTGTDLVVLPYLRSAASGPLAMVMTAGKPVVVSDLPSLREAAEGYAGVRFARAGDPDGLAEALDDAAVRLVGRTFASERSWDEAVDHLAAVASGPEGATSGSGAVR